MPNSSAGIDNQGLRHRQHGARNTQTAELQTSGQNGEKGAAREQPPGPDDTQHKGQKPAKHRRDADDAAQDMSRFDATDRILSVALTAACLFTRLYQIGKRATVTWDETHFGKFGAHYINGTFYHDVHPPLAKMLVGLGEYISGHNGSFAYTSGATYPAHINYTFQRAFVAVMGVFIVPFAYRTCRFLSFGRAGALMAASFVLLDNALCVISRFILLDPPLLCFTAMSLLGYAAFAAQKERPFSQPWWSWLAFTGMALGLVTSSKWVGLFIVALVGLCTVEELLTMYADGKTPAMTQLKHWAARIACLILVPLLVYISCFEVHFALLGSRGTGDYKMPSTFQALQHRSVVALQPHRVAFGSLVTLRSHKPGFGLIHTNTTLQFPDRSHANEEWVAGGMGGKQKYNWWRVVSVNTTWENDAPESPVVHIADNAIIRLAHNGTGHYLRTSHAQPHHIGWDRRMFVAGNESSTSLWDLWRVRIVDEESPRPRDQLYAVTTTFQLFNAVSGCLLQATGAELPPWGNKMSELICTNNNATWSESSLWNIEQVRDMRFKRARFGSLVKRRLIRNVVWLNREMAISNNKLVADPDRYKHTESSPWTWPLLLYPMRLSAWSNSSIKYYEIGNPVTWWASTVCCFLYPLQMLYWLVRWRRGVSSWNPHEFRKYWDTSKVLWGGWALHYLPFFLMGRVTYIHHYLPALYFALLLLAFEIQCLVRWYLPPRAIWYVVTLVLIATAYVSYMFLPLTFGCDKPIKELAHLAWLPTWNIHRNLDSV
ncbi:Protein O-mannosyltransferase 2 [Coemansia sp. RSA 1939]|nr:Protein O-mannosyltransferase 2 [Coemansia sp. RSA 1939]KAJ2611847.1 Protein O-mannosyltransferase 2 [Coemansia sp. RSA 1804]